MKYSQNSDCLTLILTLNVVSLNMKFSLRKVLVDNELLAHIGPVQLLKSTTHENRAELLERSAGH